MKTLHWNRKRAISSDQTNGARRINRYITWRKIVMVNTPANPAQMNFRSSSRYLPSESVFLLPFFSSFLNQSEQKVNNAGPSFFQ